MKVDPSPRGKCYLKIWMGLSITPLKILTLSYTRKKLDLALFQMVWWNMWSAECGR